MRCFIAVLLLLGALISPRRAAALDCPMLPPSSWYQPADGSAIATEAQRRDAEARAALVQSERFPIVFRGRVVSARYLSDLRKGNTPTSLLVFDHVELLKGRFYRSPSDRKAFIIHEGWCDGSCEGRVAGIGRLGETVVLGVYPNRFANPSVAVEFSSKRIIYKGRIDALLGTCSGGALLPPEVIELLNAPAGEIARLKREYILRRPNL
jgi:hypothetical protein